MIRRGKPETFTATQNALLRAMLRRYASEHGLTQVGIAHRFDVSQQTAGRYLLCDVGFSYPTATLVARTHGFLGVDDLFASRFAPASNSDFENWGMQ